VSIRTAIITDWRTRDEDLPDVPPGEEFERVITPQKHVALCRVVVRDLHLISRSQSRRTLRLAPAGRLVHLEIGVVTCAFQLESTDGSLRYYRPSSSPAVDAISVVAGLDVRVFLRNFGDSPAKPRVSLIVREEID
jgi:hypothetical protein